MGHLLKQFVSEYVRGHLENALSLVLKHEKDSYENIAVEDEGDRLIINYVEESVFGEVENLKRIALQILNLLVTEDYKSIEFRKEFLSIIAFENQLIYFTTHFENHIDAVNNLYPPFQAFVLQSIQKIELDEKDIKQVISDVHFYNKSLVAFQLNMTQGWQSFVQVYPQLKQVFKNPYPAIHPWLPISKNNDIPKVSFESIPVLFLKPFKESLQELKELKDKCCIFVFYTKAYFFQMLENPTFVESLDKDKHIIYFLDIYPNDQLKWQNVEKFRNKELKAYFVEETKASKCFEKPFINAFKNVINQSSFEDESIVSHTFYEICKRFNGYNKAERLGNFYIPSLYAVQSAIDQQDVHKGSFSRSDNLGPSMEELMIPVLKNLKKNDISNKKIKKDKYLIAHIVPQIVDEGHAPTRVLLDLICNANRDLFNILVVCTESLVNHPNEYPINNYAKETSLVSGKDAIGVLQSHQAKLIRNANLTNFAEEGKDLAAILNEYDVDMAVFHGTDVINLMGVQQTKAPLKVFFEHGLQCLFEGFDLAVLSSQDAKEIYRDIYETNNTQFEALNFVTDKNVNDKDLITKASLGLPQEALMITTISSDLDISLTDQMLRAVATILKNVPQAIFAPVGKVDNKERILKVFSNYDVEDKLHLLGCQKEPQAILKLASLYLNAFPQGNAFAMLDAMSVGCPIVSMYDRDGDQFARYAGDFLGLDKVIDGDVNEYIDLSCRLLTDSDLHANWQQHVCKQYYKFSDVKKYVKDFENILVNQYTFEAIRQ